MSMSVKLFTVAPAEIERLGHEREEVIAFVNEFGEAAAYLCDLAHMWQALDYLLSGCEGGGPRRWAIYGRHVLRRVDLGYGFPKYLTSDEVTEMTWTLGLYPKEALRAQFDLERMAAAKVYGYGDATAHDPETEWERLYDLFLELGSFYENAAGEKLAVVSYL